MITSRIGNVLTINDTDNKTYNTSAYHATITNDDISKAITYSTIKLKTYDDIILRFTEQKVQPVRFLYCHSGDAFIKFQNRKKKISNFQNAILFEQESNTITLNLKANKTYYFSMVAVSQDLKSYTKEESGLLKNLVEKILGQNQSESRCFVSSRNLAIGMALKDIAEIEGNNLANKLILAGKIRVILGLEYQQMVRDSKAHNQRKSVLTRREMQRISKVIENIKKNPGNQYTVTSLSLEAGLSENKLQQGFKELYDRTVTDCIRNIRLEKAEKLLKTTDLNVSEVVYSVGFISRSYFSKIFKAKYNCSPSFYKKQRRIADVA